MSVNRPLPVPDELSAPFWEAAADHVLTLARCSVCGTGTLPPDVVCPHCHSTAPEYTYEPVSGRGQVRSWILMRQSFVPGFDDLPYLLVDVELDDQPDVRMIARLLDGPDAPLELGTRVVVEFEDIADSVAVPAFVLDPRA